MRYLLKNAHVFIDNEFKKTNLVIENGIIVSLDCESHNEGDYVSFDFNNYYIFPGFTDVHVHLREPGFLYKETIKTGSMASAAGGYTTVCAMPNLNPVPDSVETLQVELDAIKNDAVINVLPYGAITKEQNGLALADMEEMNPYVVGFSDDGRGVQAGPMMKDAMYKAKSLNKIIAAHCEDNTLLEGGYIHKGKYAKLHGHKGICSESEWGQIARDIELCRETGCKYHVCHVSTKESVEIIRKAKAEGVNISCETAPHYLVFNDMDLEEHGRFKMNPPIRDEEDRLALIEGIKDGTIDVIATDHAPHSDEEKSKGLKDSNMGIVGIETAFAVMYTHMVKTGEISLEKLMELLNLNAKKRFGIGSEIRIGQSADITVFDLNKEYEVNPEEFLSKGRFTPFSGRKVFGKCIMTMYNGDIVYENRS